ncbi:MAG: sulfotransferase family 2 domain-containing protein [Shimia sp.]
MYLSRGRGLLFIHIPKTGGTSMALALEARAMADDVMAGDTPKARNRRRRLKAVEASGRLWKHSRVVDLYGLVTQEDLDRLTIFTLVRDPWDRVVSYYHWLRDQDFAHPAVALAKAVDFAAFATHPMTLTSLRRQPYGSYVRDRAGRDRAIYVRLEHLAEDLAPIEAHLGFRLEMPHVNRSTHFEGHTPETRAAIAQACAEDIARFGYRPGG